MPSPVKPRPTALTVAGSDSGGGAGIQADIKTLSVLGCFATTAITGLTAQNTQAVQRVSLTDPALVADQITSVATDMPLAAAKTGMLGGRGVIEATAQALREQQVAPLVVDPVMVAKSGDPLIDDEAVQALAQTMLPLATVATPNRHEAGRLLDRTAPLDETDEAEKAGLAICRHFGCGACVVKAVPRPQQVVDVLCQPDQPTRFFEGPLRDNHHTHGSGCAFSAAITAYLAQGHGLAEAVERARALIDRAIAGAEPIGQGAWPVNPLANGSGD
jgi:hydroxymethylpyrimidine/phosphomethylpyrimidine kinase